MSEIYVDISDAPGDATKEGFIGQIKCFGISHGIDLPVVQRGTARTAGSSYHGAIELVHRLDAASPKLRQLAAKGRGLGNVTVTRIRMLNGTSQAGEIISLTNCELAYLRSETRVNAARDDVDDVPLEVFGIDYEDIKWDYKIVENGQVSSNASAEFSALS